MTQVYNLAEGESIEVAGMILTLDSTSGGRAKIAVALTGKLNSRKIATHGQPKLMRGRRLIERLREVGPKD